MQQRGYVHCAGEDVQLGLLRRSRREISVSGRRERADRWEIRRRGLSQLAYSSTLAAGPLNHKLDKFPKMPLPANKVGKASLGHCVGPEASAS